MKVMFKSPQNLGNKDYAAGEQVIPDSLYANMKFQALVKSGAVIVFPRDASAQAAQASKDARNLSKAINAQENAQAIVEARAGLVNNKVIAGAEGAAPSVAEAPVEAQVSQEAQSMPEPQSEPKEDQPMHEGESE